MRAVGLLPAVAIVGGTLAALAAPAEWTAPVAAADPVAPVLGTWRGAPGAATALALLLVPLLVSVLVASPIIGLLAWWRRWSGLALVAVVCGFGAAGAALTLDATARSLQTPLRDALDAEFGGFALESWTPPGPRAPVLVRAVLRSDAGPPMGLEAPVTLRAEVLSVRLREAWMPVSGGVTISVGGMVPAARLTEWVAGRTIEAPMTFRRASRYVNDGVGDFERDLALRGVTLLASIKSSLLVDVEARGGWLDETAAWVRARTRRAIRVWIVPRDELAAAIVAAVLLGDRGGIPDLVRDRLQAAGTYHVIAISGGNIAIFVALVVAVPLLLGASGRAAAWPSIAVLAAYSQIVTAGPSVWRATLMATLHLVAIGLDHRAPAVHVAALSAAVMLVARPLDLRDPGFLLTFGATAALLTAAGRVRATGGPRLLRWTVAALVSTCAVDLMLLPVTAHAFGQVTVAGIALNLLALPLMGLVQVSGLLVVMVDLAGLSARAPAWVADVAASALVESARLVELAPWTTRFVAPPGIPLLVLYYGACAVAVWGAGRARVAASVLLAATALAVWADVRPTLPPALPPWFPWITDDRKAAAVAPLRLTMFDVGQGEALLVQTPNGDVMLVDAGGAPFGGDRFDLGRLVLAPALRARGVSAIDALVVTHADPDHVGGARAILDRFDVRRLWLGIPVPGHEPSQALVAHDPRVPVGALREGFTLDRGGVRIRVLHPPEPDWERRRVRNDDSVVLELVHGDVAVLLTGDVGADVERAILPRLSPARIRVLKVGHHGSRTSTSRELVAAWQPQVALISCGRGNLFGHPARDVIDRLERAGTRIYRTDRDGALTLESDGRQVQVRTMRDE